MIEIPIGYDVVIEIPIDNGIAPEQERFESWTPDRTSETEPRGAARRKIVEETGATASKAGTAPPQSTLLGGAIRVGLDLATAFV